MIVTRNAIKVRLPIEQLDPKPLELTKDERTAIKIFASKIRRAPKYVWVYVG